MALPALIGDYEVISLLGKGGMSEVYLVRLPGAAGFSKRAALKRMHLSEEGDERAMRSLINEARMVSQLNHPNLIDVFGFEVIDGAHCMVMEYVEGASLLDVNRHFQRRRQSPPSEIVAQIAAEVCAGLHYAHTHVAEDGTPLRLIHRDIKPANILLSRHGHVKVADFGIAKSAINPFQTTGDDVVKGTLAYMSPEQIVGEAIDARSDLFSFGLVLFEALTNQRLIKTRNITELLETIHEGYRQESRHIVDNVAPEWNPVLEGLLAASPEDRFQSAREVLESIDKHLKLASRLQVGEIVETVFQELQTKRARNQGMSTGSLTGEGPAARASGGDEDAGHTAVMPPGSQGEVFSLAGGPPPAASAEALAGPGDRATGYVFPDRLRPAGDGKPAEAPPLDGAPARGKSQLIFGALLVVAGAAAAIGVMQSLRPAVPPPAPVLQSAERAPIKATDPQAVAEPEAKAPEVAEPTPAPTAAPTRTPPRKKQSPVAAAPPRQAPVSAPSANPPPAQAGPGHLIVNAQPWATVYLDGAKKGYNLQEEVSSGSHTIKLEGPEGQEKTFTVDVKPGQKTIKVWSFTEGRFLDQ